MEQEIGSKKTEADSAIDSSLCETIVDDVLRLLVFKLTDELQGLQKEIDFQGFVVNMYASNAKEGKKNLLKATEELQKSKEDL